MDKNKEKNLKRSRRHGRVRARISGTAAKPRLNIYKSNHNIFLQIIDDDKGVTLASVHSRELDKKKTKKTADKQAGDDSNYLEYELGKLLAAKALKKKINTVVFDRGGYKYHGRIKAAAEGAREGGLKF